MKILAIDTSSKVIHIALLNKSKIFSMEKDVRHGGYEDVLCLIKKVLTRNRVKIEDINCFGICVGPGSFTGIRIGLSLIKALAYSLNRPVVTYKSLDLSAWMLKDEFSGLLCILQDARRHNIYSAVYTNHKTFKRITPYLLTDITELLNRLKKIDNKSLDIYFYGDAALTYKGRISNYFPNPRIIPSSKNNLKGQAALSYIRNNLDKKINSFEILPFYMYPKDCQVSKPTK
jgi:tRNA threonylcarbamoyladenosine biosynthesis protein TsaB